MRQKTVNKIVKAADRLAGALLEADLKPQADQVLKLSERVSNLKAEEKTLKSLPLHEALWWYIENVNDEHIAGSSFFFILRERVRNESPIQE